MLQAAGAPIAADTINREYTQADGSNTTISGTTLANLSTVYTIAGSDAGQFTTYRLTAWGTGTWSTAGALTLAMALAGVNIGTEPTIATSAFSNGAAFHWEITLTLKCNSTGPSGTWSASLRGTVTQSSNSIVVGTAADNSVPFVAITGTEVTQDTTAANSVAIQAKFAATGGSITCTDTVFERLAV